MIVLVGCRGERARTGCTAAFRRAHGWVTGCGMHKFKIGQHLFPAPSVGLNVPDGAYVIVKRLPERHGEFEYQIKNLAEPDERVVRESQLRPNPWHRTVRLAGHRQ
jgi:hypothetical protein